MRLCTFREYGNLAAGVLVGERVVGIEDLNDAWGQDFGPDVSSLIRRNQLAELARMLRSPPRLPTSGWKPESLRYAAPYDDPRKIWGIGLNFEEHAGALGEKAPEEPASFMRPSTSIGDPGAPIALPKEVGRVTGEAEIGVVVGKRLKGAVSAEEAREAVLGYVAVLDCTAEDVLRRNPRYLTRSKSYDGFLRFGPWLVTRDEWEPMPTTRIRTVLNGKLVKEGLVGNMRMGPLDLLAFHSRVFAWEPGDLLLTGTPGAAALSPADSLRCEISAFPTLECPVG